MSCSSPVPGAWARTWSRVRSTWTSSTSTSRPSGKGYRCVLRRALGAKKIKMVYAEGRTREPVVNRPTSEEERERFCLDDEQVLRLADYAIRIEDHYSRRAGRPDADGHRVGPGWPGPPALHRPGAARDGDLAAGGRRIEKYVRHGQGRGAGPRPCRRHQGRRPAVRGWSRDPRQLARVPRRRGAGRRHDDAGLGAGDEAGGRDRHQPRRADLPCRDRRPRARHPGGGRGGGTRPRRSRTVPR